MVPAFITYSFKILEVFFFSFFQCAGAGWTEGWTRECSCWKNFSFLYFNSTYKLFQEPIVLPSFEDTELFSADFIDYFIKISRSHGAFHGLLYLQGRVVTLWGKGCEANAAFHWLVCQLICRSFWQICKDFLMALKWTFRRHNNRKLPDAQPYWKYTELHEASLAVTINANFRMRRHLRNMRSSTKLARALGCAAISEAHRAA